MTTFFLIGGNGFVGNAYSVFLKSTGAKVHHILKGQISDSKSFTFNQQVLSQLPVSKVKNIIVDFAYTSVPKTSFTDPVKDFTENLYNINCHLAFASSLPNATYVYISSGGTVYGNVDKKEPISEKSDNYPLSPYGITKLASEKYAFMHRQIHELDIKIIRPSNIFGPGQRPFKGQGFIATALAKIFQRQAVQVFGSEETIRDYIYIDDFVNALNTIISEGKEGEIYNVGTGIGISISDVLSCIEKTIGYEVAINHLPTRPFDVSYNVLNIDKLKSLSWQNAFSFEYGVNQTAKWIKDFLDSDLK